MTDRPTPLSRKPESNAAPPAEWAPHDAVWLAWPSHGELWGDALPAVQGEFVALCRSIAAVDSESRTPRGERLRVLIRNEDDRRNADDALEGLGAELVPVPYGDVWLRDTAPIFGRTPTGDLVAHCFRFNGWGERYRLPGDDRVAASIASHIHAERRHHDLVLEGGAVEFDGQGTLLTTRSCLLNPNRNPGRSVSEVEGPLREAFGVERIVWLEQGLLNDHTDGHIDTLVRFVAPGHVVCMTPSGTDDPNAEVLAKLEADLGAAVDAAGRPLKVSTIGSPGRVCAADGTVLPASYVNFFIGNVTVVVPTYGTPYDAQAVEKLAALFPDRTVVGTSARRLLEGGGAFHCITQQQPSGDHHAQ